MHFVRLCVYLVWLEYGLVEFLGRQAQAAPAMSQCHQFPRQTTAGSGEEHTVSATKKLMHCLDMHLKTNQQTNKVLAHTRLPGMMSQRGTGA